MTLTRKLFQTVANDLFGRRKATFCEIIKFVSGPFSPCFVHHPADVSQASPALWVFGHAVASAPLFFADNFFHDQRFTIFQKILPDIVGSISKTITNQILIPHLSPPLTDHMKNRKNYCISLF